MTDARAYRGNRSLETAKVPGRSHPVYRFTVRTSKPPKPKAHHESVEKGEHKTMEPESRSTTLGAGLRSRPRESLLLLKNFIVGYAHSHYHGITFGTDPSRPVHTSGGRSIKPPPISYHRSNRGTITRPPKVKTPVRYPVYSEKSPSFLTTQFETLHSCARMDSPICWTMKKS